MPDQTRAKHHADLERIDAGDLVGTDTLTVFAALRDIADAEPIQWQGDVGCTMCSAVQPVRGPIEHLISCPWARAVQIVGIKPDQDPPTTAAVCRCGHYERDHETQGWRACSRRDACGCQLYTERGSADA